METVQISIRDGEFCNAGSWLYVWLPVGRSQIVYVGGTGLPPAVRAWLHLHGDDPSVARVADRYPAVSTEPLEVIAFRLPDDIDRRSAKSELIRELQSRCLLGKDYVGDQPGQARAHDHVRKTVGTIVNDLMDVFAS